jgi:hypothetical protein
MRSFLHGINPETGWRGPPGRGRLDDARRSWGFEHNIELVVHAIRSGLI